MTVRECMDAAFQLLNQYSIVGTTVPLSYNDQADTENRMINLINDAQMQIATTVRPIEKFMTVEVPRVPPITPLKDIEVELPEDAIQMKRLLFTPERGWKQIVCDASYYKVVDETKILLRNKPAGTYQIEYEVYPVRLDPYMHGDILDYTYLDNKPDTHEIIPYFVAAMIAIDENPKLYYALYNVWETRLSRLGYKNPHAENTHVVDVYGFDRFRGLW